MAGNGPVHCDVPRVEIDARDAVRKETVELLIAGMGCDNCANRVHNGLAATPGVLAVLVDRPLARATVRYDSTRTGLAALVRAVERAGRSSGHVYRAALAPSDACGRGRQ